jgi:hypothetical protein
MMSKTAKYRRGIGGVAMLPHHNILIFFLILFLLAYNLVVALPPTTYIG